MFITHNHFCYYIKYTAKEDTKFCKGGSNNSTLEIYYYNHHEILSGRSNQNGWDGQGMWHARGMINAERVLAGKKNKDLDTYGRTLLNWS
jgi:hypothetical protein